MTGSMTPRRHLALLAAGVALTRFCEANCPSKVRRFNFFGYADGQEYANLGAEPLKAQKSPEVRVRARGAMEKCTYCVQRLSRAGRGRQRDGHRDDGEVLTACQAACPTRAIAFGDLNRAESEVRRLKREPAPPRPVDYTCRTTCGPALTIAAGALARTGLIPGREFGLRPCRPPARRSARPSIRSIGTPSRAIVPSP